MELCNKHMRYIKQESFSNFLKKIKRLQHLIEGDYKINGSIIIYNDNNVRWDTLCTIDKAGFTQVE